MLVMTAGPQLFLLGAYGIEGKGPSATGTPLLLLKILIAGVGVALFYTAIAMAVSSLTTRRAVAAVAIVLLLLVPSIVAARRDREQRRPRRARAARSARRGARVRLAGLRRHPRHRRRATDHQGLDRARRRGARRLDRARCRRVPGSATAAGEAPMSESTTRRCADRGPRRLEVVRERRRRLRRQLRHRPRDHGAARPERRRQVDDAPDALRAGKALEGNGAAPRQRSALQHRASRASSGSCRSRKGCSSPSPHSRSCACRPASTAFPIPTARPGRRSRPSSSTRTTSVGCRPTRRACASGSSSPRRSSTTRG